MIDAQIGGNQIQKVVDMLELVNAVHGVALSAAVIWKYFFVEPYHIVDALTYCLLFEWLVGSVYNVSLGCIISDHSLFVTCLCFFYLRVF